MQGDDEVPFLAGIAGDDLVLVDDSHTGSGQVQSVDHLGEDGDLSADDLHVGELGTFVETDSDLLGKCIVGFVDGDVIHEGDRLGVDTDGVVDVHGDTVNSDGVPDAEFLRDEDLGSHTVGGQGDVSVTEVDETCEKTGFLDHLPESLPPVGELAHQRADGTRFFVNIYSCF